VATRDLPRSFTTAAEGVVSTEALGSLAKIHTGRWLHDPLRCGVTHPSTFS